MTDAPLRTVEEVLEAAKVAVWAVWSGGRTAWSDYENMLNGLAARIAPPPDPRHEGLRERIKTMIASDSVAADPAETLGELLLDCLAALEPAAPQPGWPDLLAMLQRFGLEEPKARAAVWLLIEQGFLDLGEGMRPAPGAAAAPQPSADDVVRAVRERAFGDAFAAKEK